jgi:hypothetical protein
LAAAPCSFFWIEQQIFYDHRHEGCRRPSDGHGRDASVRLVRSTADDPYGEIVVQTEEGVVDLAAVADAHVRGYTLAIHDLEYRWPPLAALARDIGNALKARATVGLYLTPPHSQGLAPHHDAHDHLILQVAGSKTWSLYGVQTNVRDPPTVPTGQPAIFMTELSPGDMLYVPKHMGHGAMTTGSETSLHLTIALHTVALVDIASRAIALKAATNPRFFGTAPLAVGQPLDEAARNACAELFVIEHELELAYEELVGEELRKNRPVADGHFRSLAQATSLTSSTRLFRRLHGIEIRALDAQTAVARQGTADIFVPLACVGALRFVASNKIFSVCDLPGAMTNEAKIALARELIVRGFVGVVA